MLIHMYAQTPMELDMTTIRTNLINHLITQAITQQGIHQVTTHQVTTRIAITIQVEAYIILIDKNLIL